MPSFGRAVRLTLLIVFVLPVAAKAFVWSLEERPRNWWEARWTSAGILPAPADDPEPRWPVWRVAHDPRPLPAGLAARRIAQIRSALG